MTITKTGLTYTATSLEDIAAEFERLAGESDTYPDESHDYCAGLANAFEQAAAILRATKLEPPSDNVGKSDQYKSELWGPALDAGRQDFNEGKPLSANPYIGFSSTLERLWRSGWEIEQSVAKRSGD